MAEIAILLSKMNLIFEISFPFSSVNEVAVQMGKPLIPSGFFLIVQRRFALELSTVKVRSS